MTSVPWLLVNRFTVLEIETNTDNSEPINVLPPSIPKHNPSPQRPKWEKRLSIQLSTSVLDIHGTSLQLTVELSTIDTGKLHSMEALLDSRAIGSFIDQGFICSKGLNIWTILCPIPVFNVDGSPNEVGEISEVVVSQLYYGLVVTYCMVYYYTKRATLARLLANEGPAIYVVL